jgi:hypothetical protein
MTTGASDFLSHLGILVSISVWVAAVSQPRPPNAAPKARCCLFYCRFGPIKKRHFRFCADAVRNSAAARQQELQPPDYKLLKLLFIHTNNKYFEIQINKL